MKRSFSFQDIALVPQKNICKSRLDANIESEIIRGVIRPIPIISSNMKSVTNADFAIMLYRLGAFGILHRAWADETLYLKEAKKVGQECRWAAASIGIDKEAYELARLLVAVGINIICIDIANGYCDRAIKLGRKIKNHFGNEVKVVIGNSTNIGFLEECADFADAVKIGIGSNSSVCETFIATGFTEGQFSAVLKFKELSKYYGIPVISDGGIRNPKDVCLAIAAGANSAMLGTVLAKCPESAGETVLDNGQLKKIYQGMSSREVQEKWRGMKKGICPEGKQILLDIGESVKSLLERYSGALRSSITYGGATDIISFQEKAEFLQI